MDRSMQWWSVAIILQHCTIVEFARIISALAKFSGCLDVWLLLESIRATAHAIVHDHTHPCL